MFFEYCGTSLHGFYSQGSAVIGTPFEQVIKATGAFVDARGGSPSGSDYFKYLLVASSSATVTGNVSVGSATISNFSLSTGAKYFNNGTNAGENVFLAVTGATTTAVYTMTARRSYSVSVAGIYDGFLKVGDKFDVLHYQSGFTTVLTAAGGSGLVTCTVSGDNIQINTVNPNGYGLYISIVDQKALGNEGVF
jgi:hypothetical protein